MRIWYLAPQLSHRMVPSECSKSIRQLHEAVLPQNGQSNICATLGLAFFGGGFARLRFPLRARRAERRTGHEAVLRAGARRRHAAREFLHQLSAEMAIAGDAATHMALSLAGSALAVLSVTGLDPVGPT